MRYAGRNAQCANDTNVKDIYFRKHTSVYLIHVTYPGFSNIPSPQTTSSKCHNVFQRCQNCIAFVFLTENLTFTHKKSARICKTSNSTHRFLLPGSEIIVRITIYNNRQANDKVWFKSAAFRALV